LLMRRTHEFFPVGRRDLTRHVLGHASIDFSIAS
jgi:hypothetical protein